MTAEQGPPSRSKSPETRWRGLRVRLRAFVLERHPFAMELVTEAFDASPGSGPAPPRPGCYSRLRLGQDGTVVEVYNADPGAAGETGGR